jgi:hypothetical protein
VPCLLDMVYTCHDIFDLRSLEGIPFCFAGPCLVASFGRTSLAWASMGLQAHRLDAKGPHADDHYDCAFGGLEDNMEDMTYPSHAKRFFLGEEKCHLWRLDVT